MGDGRGRSRWRRAWVFALALSSLVLGGMVYGLQRFPTFSAPTGVPNHFVGAYHVHSARSHDSKVPPQVWAAAAARAGLDFIVLTDHNVEPQRPQMIDGVLVLFEREASTPHGHRVDLGGRAIAAHPTDPKRPWLGPLHEMSGLEIASTSASVRRCGGFAYLNLLPALFVGLLRPEAGLLQIYDRDQRALDLWDHEPHRPFAGLCSADAHGWLPASLEMSLWRVALPTEGIGRPVQPEHAPAILEALAKGRSFCLAGVLPVSWSVQLRAQDGHGQWLALADGSLSSPSVQQLEARVDVGAEAPPGKMLLQIFRDGLPVCTTSQKICSIPTPGPGVYRSEVSFDIPKPLWGSRRVPLLYGNRVLLTAGDHD